MQQTVFARRRKEFMDRIGEGVAIFSAAPVRLRNGDVEYEYRQDSDFYYLTGFEEPESICVLSPTNQKHQFVLFVRPRDKEKEVWTGRRSGIEGAMQNYGAEMAFTQDRFEEVATELLQDVPSLYYSLNKDHEMDQRIFHILESVRQKQRLGIYGPSEIIDPWEILADMRFIKKAEELEALRKAAVISASGHVAAMASAKPGMHEYEIQAILEYVFRASGSMRNGYPSIVGSGPNTCILHYTNNNRLIQQGDLILIDAGAEFDYYTADITRTFPATGKFTPQQSDVYDVVLNAQRKAIEVACPGNTHLFIHQTAVRELTEGMISLGLLSGSAEENIEKETYKKYFMHKTGHWLGMDVHDAGKYRVSGNWQTLQPGVVMTVEPGIYISEDDEHEAFRNIGVRIEDDVLITEDGPVELTSDCPKKREDIESIVGTASALAGIR
jgi:Xaa-Pro aminopeptidase